MKIKLYKPVSSLRPSIFHEIANATMIATGINPNLYARFVKTIEKCTKTRTKKIRRYLLDSNVNSTPISLLILEFLAGAHIFFSEDTLPLKRNTFNSIKLALENHFCMVIAKKINVSDYFGPVYICLLNHSSAVHEHQKKTSKLLKRRLKRIERNFDKTYKQCYKYIIKYYESEFIAIGPNKSISLLSRSITHKLIKPKSEKKIAYESINDIFSKRFAFRTCKTMPEFDVDIDAIYGISLVTIFPSKLNQNLVICMQINKNMIINKSQPIFYGNKILFPKSMSSVNIGYIETNSFSKINIFIASATFSLTNIDKFRESIDFVFTELSYTIFEDEQLKNIIRPAFRLGGFDKRTMFKKHPLQIQVCLTHKIFYILNNILEKSNLKCCMVFLESYGMKSSVSLSNIEQNLAIKLNECFNLQNFSELRVDIAINASYKHNSQHTAIFLNSDSWFFEAFGHTHEPFFSSQCRNIHKRLIKPRKVQNINTTISQTQFKQLKRTQTMYQKNIILHYGCIEKVNIYNTFLYLIPKILREKIPTTTFLLVFLKMLEDEQTLKKCISNMKDKLSCLEDSCQALVSRIYNTGVDFRFEFTTSLHSISVVLELFIEKIFNIKNFHYISIEEFTKGLSENLKMLHLSNFYANTFQSFIITYSTEVFLHNYITGQRNAHVFTNLGLKDVLESYHSTEFGIIDNDKLRTRILKLITSSNLSLSFSAQSFKNMINYIKCPLKIKIWATWFFDWLISDKYDSLEQYLLYLYNEKLELTWRKSKLTFLCTTASRLTGRRRPKNIFLDDIEQYIFFSEQITCTSRKLFLIWCSRFSLPESEIKNMILEMYEFKKNNIIMYIEPETNKHMLGKIMNVPQYDTESVTKLLTSSNDQNFLSKDIIILLERCREELVSKFRNLRHIFFPNTHFKQPIEPNDLKHATYLVRRYKKSGILFTAVAGSFLSLFCFFRTDDSVKSIIKKINSGLKKLENCDDISSDIDELKPNIPSDMCIVNAKLKNFVPDLSEHDAELYILGMKMEKLIYLSRLEFDTNHIKRNLYLTRKRYNFFNESKGYYLDLLQFFNEHQNILHSLTPIQTSPFCSLIFTQISSEKHDQEATADSNSDYEIFHGYDHEDTNNLTYDHEDQQNIYQIEGEDFYLKENACDILALNKTKCVPYTTDEPIDNRQNLETVRSLKFKAVSSEYINSNPFAERDSKTFNIASDIKEVLHWITKRITCFMSLTGQIISPEDFVLLLDLKNLDMHIDRTLLQTVKELLRKEKIIFYDETERFIKISENRDYIREWFIAKQVRYNTKDIACSKITDILINTIETKLKTEEFFSASEILKLFSSRKRPSYEEINNALKYLASKKAIIYDIRKKKQVFYMKLSNRNFM